MKCSAVLSCICVSLVAISFAGCGSSADSNATSDGSPVPTAQTNDQAQNQSKPTKNQEPSPAELAAAKMKLIGTWKGEVEILPKGYDQTVAVLSEDQDETTVPQFKALVEYIRTTKATIELKEDHSMKMSFSVTHQGEQVTQPDAGTWEITDVRGDEVVVKFVREKDNHEEAQRFSFQTDDAFSTNGPGGEALEDVAILKFNRLR